MNSWRVILATMVIFGTGVVTGGLLVRQRELPPIQQHPPGPNMARPVQQGQPGSPGGMRVDLLRRMSRDLDLTPEQHEKVDKILKESQDRTKKVMSPFLREEMERTSKEFREVLTADQQVRFDGLLKEKRGREPRHPPSDRPVDGPRQPGVATNQ